MVKLLYLLAGIALKQAVDELKALHAEYLDHLKRFREAVQTYRGNPAVEAGSREAHAAIARHKHQASVEPEVKRLSRKILLLRMVPFVAYAGLTVGLIVAIWLIEREGE